MRYLTANDIKSVFSMREAIDADAKAFELYSSGHANIPLRTNLGVPEANGLSLIMPGYVNDTMPALGVKIISIYPDNAKNDLPTAPSTMIVVDANTGIVSGLLDGTYLTQLRTGAAAGLATDLLARKDSRQALLIGTGSQAMTQLEALLTVRKLEKVFIAGRNFEKLKQFCEQASSIFATEFTTLLEPIENPNDVVAEVDIITTITSSKVPTFDGKLVKPGTHVNGVGSFTPEMLEVPFEVIDRAQTIIFDTMDGVLAEAGEIIQPLEDGRLTRDQITGELGQLVNGDISGRTAIEEITFFKCVGSAVLDVVVADRIMRTAESQNIGIELN